MNLDDASGGDVQPQGYWFESELTQVSIKHSQPHRTPPNAGGKFHMSSLQSQQWGPILCHCCIVSYTNAEASKQFKIKVDPLNTMNKLVFDWRVDHERRTKIYRQGAH